MKRGYFIFFVLAIMLFFLSVNYIAADCSLDALMINQDPIYAVPGEEVKVLFQLQGVEDPNCGEVIFEILEQYPFTIDPSSTKKVEIKAGTFQADYNSYLNVPYTLRVDKDALDGESEIKVKYGSKQDSFIESFNISIKDVLVDFVVTVDSYSYATKKLTLGIVNVGESNVKSATIEIPSQQNIDIQGGHVKILGDLDSNEDTTLTFDALPKDGNIKVIISYNDETNQRRTIEKSIAFTGALFENTKQTNTKMSNSVILLLITWVAIIAYIFYARRKAKKLLDKQRFMKR